MQKNYLTKMTKSMINPLASTSKNWKKSTTTWLVALFVICGVSDVFGQVTINTANGSINSCTYPTSYVALGDIFLEENQNANFNIILQNFNRQYLGLFI